MSNLHEEYRKISQKVIVAILEYADVKWDELVDLSTVPNMVSEDLRQMASQAVISPGVSIHGLDDDEGLLAGVPVPDEDEVPSLIYKLHSLGERVKVIGNVVNSLDDMQSCDPIREKIGMQDIMSTLSTSTMFNVKTDNITWPDGVTEESLQETDRSGNQITGTVFDMWCVLGSGELGILMAAPNVGKSTALVDLACGYLENAQEGVVVWFSEEMSKQAVMAKCATRICRSEIYNQQMVKDNWPGNVELVIESHATGTSTVGFLRDRIRRLVGNKKVVAIIIDYLGLLKGHARERFDNLAEVTLGLKGLLASNFECPVWTAVQPQRNASRENRNAKYIDGFDLPVLTMADISECWAIPQITDYIISMNQTESERNTNPSCLRMYRAKVRWPSKDAPSMSTLMCNIDYATCQVL